MEYRRGVSGRRAATNAGPVQATGHWRSASINWCVPR